jgi:hypothetical protein
MTSGVICKVLLMVIKLVAKCKINKVGDVINNSIIPHVIDGNGPQDQPLI